MKAEFHIKNHNQAGVSTLEILISLALITISISSATVIVSGNQSISVDNQTNNQALSKVQAFLETKRFLARQDFNSINSESRSLDSLGQPYYKEFKVSDICSCLKQVSAIYDWALENNRHATVTLITELSSTSTLASLGGDCCTSPPPGSPPGSPPGDDWGYPDSYGEAGRIAGQGIDIDVRDNFMFLAEDVKNDQDLFMVDISNKCSPISKGSVSSGGIGYLAIDATNNYVYAVNQYKFANKKYKEELLVIKVDKDNPLLPLEIVSRKNLQDTSVTPRRDVVITDNSNSDSPRAHSIYYYDNKIYIGISSDKLTGPEFHIFDVSNPNNPEEEGSVNLNLDINKIIVRNGLAFLATSGDTDELIVVDVNPGSLKYLQAVSSYNAENAEDAISMYISGNKLYLGRIGSNSNPNFYILNIEDPYNITFFPREENNDVMDKNNKRVDIKDMIVIGSLAFLATGDINEEFQVFDVSNPNEIKKISNNDCLAGHATANDIRALDDENNLIYATFRSNVDIQIFKPGSNLLCPTSCP